MRVPGGLLRTHILGFRISADHELRIAGGSVLVSTPQGRVHVPFYSAAAAAAAKALSEVSAGEPVAESDLLTKPPQDAAAGDLLQHLARLGALERVLTGKDGPLAVVEPVSRSYTLEAAAGVPEDRALRLSRFSYIRADDGCAVLESPLCRSRLRLLDAALAGMVMQLARPATVRAIVGADPVLEEYLGAAAALLAAEGFIGPATAAGGCELDERPSLRTWEFHDLLFHARSRIGRHNSPVGGTFRFYGTLEPLPAVKPPMAPAALPLVRPDLARAARQDMPLTAAIEQRRSVRAYGASPVSLAGLGEFLYRVARVRYEIRGGPYESSSRPYPNGGASYELELYPIVDRCRGLLPGFYHYDPLAHALEPLGKANAVTEQFLQDAGSFSGQAGRPEILFVIAARFGRVSWKYASIAYATILKNVGALYQTMYLVATTMGLAPCALGAGDSDRFSLLLGDDYYRETAVGEFMLGSLPPSLPPR